jgi:NAD(P)H-dependent FMN reductase
MKIRIVSASTRINRLSHRIALALKEELLQRKFDADIIDLKTLALHPFEERIDRLESPDPRLLELKQELLSTQAFIFLTPEYNGAIASGLKNFMDVFAKEPFLHKPIGVATGSTGAMGGIRAAYQLQQNILTIHGLPHPQMLTVGKMDQVINEEGQIVDEAYAKKQSRFLDLFLDFAQRLV